ncbi:hypothetical protein EII25_03420 [Erysipelotrichaceae bacterium OH741_COT-311]|nr:hypothetical protein EII25_03420 [Erysipelotrichaceae bacterium OH741_COT-311]
MIQIRHKKKTDYCTVNVFGNDEQIAMETNAFLTYIARNKRYNRIFQTVLNGFLKEIEETGGSRR